MARKSQKLTDRLQPLLLANDPTLFTLWMASLEVDQKFLGHFAKSTGNENPLLSSMLYKILGLSVLLSKKLLRARRLRRLDPTRDTKSVQQLYHHIIWLSREGLTVLEQFVIPMVDPYTELKVLSYKLRASFYHIFVLFHNQPSITQAGSTMMNLGDGLTPDRLHITKSKALSDVGSIGRTPTPSAGLTRMAGGPISSPPPGLPIPPAAAQPTANFLLPAVDYIPNATSCFQTAAFLSENLLPGSHPIRLSVKLEYVAYIYDCLHDPEMSGKLAKQTIADVYNAQEGMDDESFEDAAELVGTLGRMMKRGLSGAGGVLSTGNAVETNGAPRAERSNGQRISPPRNGIVPAVPSPGMENPI
ncbi:MAG: hypothetical protein Q9227_007440 [Pyrenula ochraceoflavens]